MRLFLIIFLFFVSCSDANLPLLPDIDTSIDDADVLMFDNETGDVEEPEGYEDTDVVEIETTLLVGTVKGYDVPFSGEVFYSSEEKISDLAKISHTGFGSSTGSDIDISTWDEGFIVTARHDSSEIYIYQDRGKDEFTFTGYKDDSDTYLNFHSTVYNHMEEEFIISANAVDELISFKDGKTEWIKISDDENISPSKMRVINDTLFVALQNMNDSFVSREGSVAVISLSDYSYNTVLLPAKNPVGKIEYNPVFDRKNIYIACSGSWQKRDGALVRVNIETLKSEVVLEESSETGSILNGDFVDVSITDSGLIYIVFSDNSERWINKLLEFDTVKGTIKEVDSGINAFAANPIDYSSLTGKIYYFADKKDETYLKSLDVVNKNIEEELLEHAPASLRIWKRIVEKEDFNESF